MKKILSTIICALIVTCLCSCGNQGNKSSKFDSEYEDDYSSFGIMKEWEQTEDKDNFVSWKKGEDFFIKYHSYITLTNGITSEEIKQDLLEVSEVNENTKLESKQIGDYDCFIAKDIKIYNNECENYLEFCPNGLMCRFWFSDSAESTVIDMIKTLKIDSLSKKSSILDSDWESSYIKFNTSSKWTLSYESDNENSQSVYFEWLSDKGGNKIDLHFHESKYYEKLTTYELEEEWNEMQEMCKIDPDNYGETDESLKITDSFVENGVPYIVISSDNPYYKEIEFRNEGIKGTIGYATACEDIVMELISTIEFY